MKGLPSDTVCRCGKSHTAVLIQFNNLFKCVQKRSLSATILFLIVFMCTSVFVSDQYAFYSNLCKS